MMATHVVLAVTAGNRLQNQLSITWMTVMMTMMLLTNCHAQTICPESSSNCSVAGIDSQYGYVYGMSCFDLGVQEQVPDACQHLFIVRELTLQPGTTAIRTIQASVLDGLRVQKLVLSGLGIEAVSYTHLTLPTNREV